MEESLVIKKLLNVDMELHSLIAGLRIKKHNFIKSKWSWDKSVKELESYLENAREQA